MDEASASAHAAALLRARGNRWTHTRAVAECARRVGALLEPAEREVLVAAAYLHDLGYAPELARTGFHPLDGARYLRGLGHERLAGLVAHHSGARQEAALRGLAQELSEFEDENSPVSRLLAFCDMTTGPAGEPMTLDERLAEVEQRYSPEHVVSRGLALARRWLAECVAWVEGELARRGLDGGVSRSPGGRGVGGSG